MKLMLNVNGDTQHCYLNDNDFIVDYVQYQRDECNGRGYYLEASVSRTSKAGRTGGFVRRRVSRADYNAALAKCKAILADVPDSEEQLPEDYEKHLAANALYLKAHFMDGDIDDTDVIIPQISGEYMASAFEADLGWKIFNPNFNVTSETAPHQAYGFRSALKELGLLDPKECNLDTDRFPTDPSLAKNTDYTQLTEIKIVFGNPDVTSLKVFINGEQIPNLKGFSIEAQDSKYPTYKCERYLPIPEKFGVRIPNVKQASHSNPAEIFARNFALGLQEMTRRQREEVRAEAELTPEYQEAIKHISSCADLVRIIHFWWLEHKKRSCDKEMENTLWLMYQHFRDDHSVL